MIEPDLGSQSFWATALAAQGLPALTPKAPRRALQQIDPLGIELLGIEPVVRPQPGAGCTYRAVGSIAELREYLRPSLQDRVPYGADWETTSLNTLTAQPVGFSASVEAMTGVYVPVGHSADPHDNLPLGELLTVLKELDANGAGATSLWYNAGYDLEVMSQQLHWEPTRWEDTQIGVFLVDSNALELGLKATALRLLGVRMQTIDELDTAWVRLSQAQQRLHPPTPLHRLPISQVAPYASADADLTRRIRLHPAVVQAKAQQPLIWQLEHWLVPVLRAGIRHGVYLDPARLRVLMAEAESTLGELRPAIQQHLGDPPITLSQRAKLGQRLYELKAIGQVEKNERSPDYGQWVAPRTPTGVVTTNKKVLDLYRTQHPVIPLLIQYAELEAQHRNYLSKLLRAAEHFQDQPWAQGRCRFAFNALGVPTGRMKCGGAGKAGFAYAKGMVDVNGQSLPDHDKAPYLPNTRSAIVAPPGYVVLAADFSQIELRIPANLSKEPVWLDAFLTGKDIHLVNAQTIANVREPGLTVTKEDKRRRSHAKSTSFALLYGGDAHTIARNAGIPLHDAQQIYDAFYQGLPKLKHWIGTLQQHARTHKQARTFMGRIRHLGHFYPPEPPRQNRHLHHQWLKLTSRGDREAVNDPIQGGAADIFKLACCKLSWAQDHMVTTGHWSPDLLSPQVFWVHDEVVWYVRADAVARVVPVLRHALEFPISGWPVPLKADFEVSSSRLLHPEDPQDTDPLTDTHSYGELVPLQTWLAHYGDSQLPPLPPVAIPPPPPPLVDRFL